MHLHYLYPVCQLMLTAVSSCFWPCLLTAICGRIINIIIIIIIYYYYSIIIIITIIIVIIIIIIIFSNISLTLLSSLGLFGAFGGS